MAESCFAWLERDRKPVGKGDQDIRELSGPVFKGRGKFPWRVHFHHVFSGTGRSISAVNAGSEQGVRRIEKYVKKVSGEWKGKGGVEARRKHRPGHRNDIFGDDREFGIVWRRKIHIYIGQVDQCFGGLFE